ncbi:hypothetical protein [Phocicoccus pinnipedialis]|uniref:Uncharacterized protein n=1 Tax=Phocicoccus pinnipedialis TaxID=110845 RepID=A0A6V7R046_9BACL|nr:hypothetical protein [Jeotgalicoccus pinnipedialis]MBP1938727.1 ABC-2 type transport system permease protein [Jeotgalicoccus pinnipedialis]CAD2070545.1 hypothetical protein JEOPIN946_00037 [Jeotgalicoccus pinnipedialis]
MKSKILSSNSVLTKYFTGTIFWVTFAYTLLMIILVPVSLYIMSKANQFNIVDPESYATGNILIINGYLQMIVSMVFAVTLAVMLFGFKNKEASSDYIHSLPIKRGSIFMSANIVGFLAMIIPLGTVVVIALIMSPFLEGLITPMEISVWALFTLVVQFIIYSISLFVGFLVNSLNLHLEMIVIAMFLPIVLFAFVILNGSYFFNGVAENMILNSNFLTNLSFPVSILLDMSAENLGSLNFIFWIVLAMILFAGSYILYKNRKNENVNSVFNYTVLYNISVTILTILGMLMIGLVLTVLIPIGLVITVFMFAIGALISYILALMFMQDNVRIKFELKNILITLAIIALFWIIFIAGWKMYVSHVPEISEVEAVKVSDWTSTQYFYDSETEKYFRPDYEYTRSTKDVKNVISLHETLQNQELKVYNTDQLVNTVNINYLLKDGSKIHREYQVTEDPNGTIMNELKKLDNSALTAKRDFFYNLKEGNEYETGSLEIFNFYVGDENTITNKVVEKLQKNYNDAYVSLKTLNQPAVKYTGKVPFGLGVKTGYTMLYGESSIYNTAVTDFLKEYDYSMSTILNLEDPYTSMYKLDLSKVKNKDKIYEDLNYMSYEEFKEAYNIETLEGEERSKAMKQLDTLEFNTEGDSLILITPMMKEEDLVLNEPLGLYFSVVLD